MPEVACRFPSGPITRGRLHRLQGPGPKTHGVGRAGLPGGIRLARTRCDPSCRRCIGSVARVPVREVRGYGGGPTVARHDGHRWPWPELGTSTNRAAHAMGRAPQAPNDSTAAITHASESALTYVSYNIGPHSRPACAHALPREIS